MTVDYKVTTECQGTGFKSIAEISKGEIDDLELLYMAYGSLHVTSLIWARMAFRIEKDHVEYPDDNVMVWANMLMDMMQDVKEKMAQEGLVSCSCEDVDSEKKNKNDEGNEDENESKDNRHQSYLKFSTNWNPQQLN